MAQLAADHVPTSMGRALRAPEVLEQRTSEAVSLTVGKDIGMANQVDIAHRLDSHDAEQLAVCFVPPERRAGSDRRGNERRARLHGGPRKLAQVKGAVRRERRTALRRIDHRRSPLDRRAPYPRFLDDSLQTIAVS